MMLAMVPSTDVPDVFNQIVDIIPDTLQIEPLLGYFERIWITGLSGNPARFQNPTIFLEPDRHGGDRPQQDQ